jgi:integrase
MGTSHQKGWVMVRGKKWYGYFRRTVLDPAANEPKPIITPVVLGLKSEMTKFEAREKLEREIARLTGHTTEEGVVRNGSITLGWFVHNRYLPLKEADWKEETAKIKKHLIEADLLAEFGEIRLERFDKLVLQAHLNKLAKTRSKDRVLQCRAYIRSIFAEAVDQDFLLKDPARKLKTPVNLRDTDKTVLTWNQLRSALAALELRNRILLKLDMTNALRPGELFAFRWSSLDEEHNKLNIRETIYKGKIRPWGKTKGSLTAIPVTGEQVEELEEWRRISKYAAPDDFIFAGRSGNFMDPSNYRKRVLHKLAVQLGLPKLTFQVIRRTIATLAKDKGHVKDIQGMLRHSRVATTTDVYMQTMEDGVRSTVTSIHEELMGTGTTGQHPARAKVRQRIENFSAGEATLKGEVLQAASSERQKPGIKHPARGKVLEFATKMLPS